MEKGTKELFRKFEIKEFKEDIKGKKLGFKRSSDSILMHHKQNIRIATFIDSIERILNGKYIACSDSNLIIKAKSHRIKTYYKIPLNQLTLFAVETPGLHVLRVTYISTLWWTALYFNYSVIYYMDHPFLKKLDFDKWRTVIY